MPKKILMTGIVVLLALLIVSCATITTKIEASQTRKANVSDYWKLNFKEQVKVKVYDNYVTVSNGEIKIGYYDYDQDMHVDIYRVSVITDDPSAMKDIVNIHSKRIWEKEFIPYGIHNFNNAQKYMDKTLQKIVDKDYKTLRKKGERVNDFIAIIFDWSNHYYGPKKK